MVSSCLVRETTDRGEIVQVSFLPEPVRQSGFGRGERKLLLQHLGGRHFSLRSIDEDDERLAVREDVPRGALCRSHVGEDRAPFDRMILIGSIMSFPG